MSAPVNSSIRLRLFFDYPPPAVVSCRMCWLLVDLNTCRVVADLESVIRDKFEFSRGSILSLFIEDCYLPHTESIYVVRDNDSVRRSHGLLHRPLLKQTLPRLMRKLT
uniref:Coilin N-terminal domain-containing protein n=1 Tax=Amphiprion percula TaxID=161767 RepID=A0A3P8U4W8_AMPPE